MFKNVDGDFHIAEKAFRESYKNVNNFPRLREQNTKFSRFLASLMLL